MLRVSDLPDFAYFRERGFYRVERHPHLSEPVVAERAHARSAALADAASAPAPLAGEHTEDVISDWLGLSEARIQALVASGVLEPMAPDVLAAAVAATAEPAMRPQTA
jgi:crotonobetainyl-CoA:carnitine CoA-transferase CaiB-like acyl-CoA transferase